MIIGIGTDIVSIDRIQNSLDQHGERFLDRCFTKAEQKIAKNKKQPTAYYAKRWAAKESCAKAFGTGIGETIGFQDIDISQHDDARKPIITVSEKAKTYLQQQYPSKTIKIDLSLSDEEKFALAFVVISIE